MASMVNNPLSLKVWWSYLISHKESPFPKRSLIYERALESLPGSHKLWQAYLVEFLQFCRNLPVSDPQYHNLNTCFERALVSMNKMPSIWILYLSALIHQNFVTSTRRTFDRALSALPVTQHSRIWDMYLVFVSKDFVPVETSVRVYKRYLMFDPSGIEDFIQFLLNSERWKEAVELLIRVLNDDQFYSIKGKTKHMLWVELCELLTNHADHDDCFNLNVDHIIRSGIHKFTEVGRLWTSLAEYYIRRRFMEKARDVFEEGITTVVTVRDFGVLFDAYSQFEESMLALKMEEVDESEDEEEEEDNEEHHDDRLDMVKLQKKLNNFWLCDHKDVNLRLARLEYLMDRRPVLANTVLLRQNPHNVEQWHRRVQLFNGNPIKQIITYAEGVMTVDTMKAVGKPHTLWVGLANLYENHKDLRNARLVFEKAVQVSFKHVDHLVTVWSEWVEMEIRAKNFHIALELLRRATAEPSPDLKSRVAAEGNEPVQMKIHKSLRLWTLYVDLEESTGTMESTREIYERIIEIKIATPQIIINYALLLESKKYFEEAFKVYERGVKIFKYPHVKEIWITYLSKFVKRYWKSKLERARELFQNAVEAAPAEFVKPIYLQYAKLEEDFGLAKRAIRVYDQAVKAVPANEKLSMYEIYIARATEILGVLKAKEIYEQAIESGLPDKDMKIMCLKYADLEKSLGEVDRARALYKHSCQLADPRSDPDFWTKWQEFEVQHGNEDTYREMLRVKRSVSASYSQTHFIPAEYLMQKDHVQKSGFVSADGNQRNQTNAEDIELPEDSDSGEDDKVEIAEREVPDAVFRGLVRKRGEKGEPEAAGDKGDSHPGALERIKRMRHGS